jgi:hypothetical protein
MTLAKNSTDGMKYEAGKVDKTAVSRDGLKNYQQRELSKISTGKLVWHLVKRHKLAISVIINIYFIVNWALPMWPSIVKSII